MQFYTNFRLFLLSKVWKCIADKVITLSQFFPDVSYQRIGDNLTSPRFNCVEILTFWSCLVIDDFIHCFMNECLKCFHSRGCGKEDGLGALIYLFFAI